MSVSKPLLTMATRRSADNESGQIEWWAVMNSSQIPAPVPSNDTQRAEFSAAITPALLQFYAEHAREIVWRTPATTAWGVLLSEVMSQQTPVRRVEPSWEEWMERWPTPTALAAADTADVLRAWGKLGYPRRALRLKECAQAIVDLHGGEVPSAVEDLLKLPGIGEYTSRAVAAFSYRQRVPVVDTNVRRVYSRLVDGRFLPGTPSKKELAHVEAMLPEDSETAATWSVAIMELGALICTTKPQCELCPLKQACSWQQLGCPAPKEEDLAKAKKRVQKFEGTDRQVRGKIMAVLREAHAPVPQSAIDIVWPDGAQRSRALYSLLDDGLAVQHDNGMFSLP